MTSLVLPTFADVEAAAGRIAPFVRETPVLTHPALDQAAGAEILIKAESLQVTGSFKMRGAANRLCKIPQAERSAGVVAFSSGNHAQGVARAARLLGMPALIVMPSDAPAVKIAGVRADGAEIHLYDRHRESREDIAAGFAEARGAVLVPSYDDADIIAGQGTAGLEFARQVERMGLPLDHLICCTGGGGLITGMALAFEAVSPATRVWTSEPAGHEDWQKSLAAGRILANDPGTRSICDAILTPRPGNLTFAIGQRLIAGGLVVTDADVRAAMRLAARHLKLVVEPGGAAALAAIVGGLPQTMRGGRVGIMLTGANIDLADFTAILASEG